MKTLPAPFNVSALAREHGVSRTTIRRRLQGGWTPAAVEIMAPVSTASTPVHSWTPAVLIVVAFAIGLLAVVVNAQAGFSLGSTPMARATFAGMAVAADALAIILPAAAVALWRRRRPLLATLAWTLWTAVAALAVLMTIGFTERHLGDTAAAREAVVAGSTAAGDRNRAAVEAAQLAVTTATTQRQAECVRRGPLCRDREADERAALAGLRSALAAPLPAPASIGVADPQAVAAQRLASWAGLSVTAADIVNLRLALLMLIPNAAGLVLGFGLALRW